MAINPPKKPQAAPSYPRQAQAAARALDARVASSLDDGLPKVQTATQSEFDAARTRLQQQRVGNATPTVQPVKPSALSPAEAEAFQRQNPNFSRANPTAPTAANAAARTNMGATPPPRPTLAEGLAPSNSVPAGNRVPVMQRVGGTVRQVGDAVKAGTQRLGNVGLRGAGALAGGAVAANAAANMVNDGAVNATDSGDLLSGVAGTVASLGMRLNPIAGAAATGWGAGRLVGGLLPEDATDAIGGTVSNVVKMFGGEGADDDGYLQQKAEQRLQAQPAAPAATQGEPRVNMINPNDPASMRLQPPGNPQVAAQRDARIRANDGIVPVDMRTGAAGEVIGTFNGKPITREAATALAGNQSLGGTATQTAAPTLDAGLQAPRGAANFSAGAIGGGSEERAADLLDGTTAAGKLYQQLLQDKTPTGKRMAGQFAETYLNGGTAERGQNADLEQSAMGANAAVTNANTGAASDLARTRLAAKTQAQYQTDDSGQIISIADGLATPVKGADGKPVKAGAKGGANALDSIAKLDEIVRGRMPDKDFYDTAEDYEAAAAKVRQQLMVELGLTQKTEK